MDFPSKAFDPFFSDPVAFETPRPEGTRRGSVRACIFDEGFADVFDEGGTSSRVARISLQIRKRDWAAASPTPPRQGDRFTSPNSSKTYAATSVTHFTADTWSIEAREVTR